MHPCKLSCAALALALLPACSSSPEKDMQGAGDRSAGQSNGGTSSDGSTGSSSGRNDSTGAGGANGSTASSDGGTASSDGGTASSGGSSAGTADDGSGGTSAPSAADLLGKVASCSASAAAIKDGFGLDGAGDISMYRCGGAVYWKADMDVDCDGIQTPPCDTDRTGQPQTSIVDMAPNGDVDPTKLPYFVIPLGKPETAWYTHFDIQLGQVGAVIYKDQVRYGIFADEAGGWFIGESSYAMCQLFLGQPNGSSDPCDPNQGGIDPADVTYVTFTGSAYRASGNDIYDHDEHTAMGIAGAEAWLAQ